VDLRRTEEQQQLRATLRRLFDRRLAALVDALPDAPRHDAAADLADAQAVGLTGLGLPEECGGAGTFADLVVAHEEIGRGLGGPLFMALASAGRLLRHATGGSRGELVAAVAEGRWDVLGPSAQTDGVEWQEEPSGVDLSSWTLRVAADLADEHGLELDGDGRRLVLSEIAVVAAAQQLGGSRAVLERTIDHVKTREQFDRPIGTFQAVQHQLADVATELDAVSLAVAQAAWAVDAALAPDERCRLADIAALTAATAFRRATLVAHQLHGGMGFVLDSPLHLWSARAIADPAVRRFRRDVLDDLATASGITAEGVTAPQDRRLIRR